RARAENRAVVIVYTLEDLVRYQQLAPDIMISGSFTSLAEVDEAREARVNFGRVVAFAGVGSAEPALVRRLRSLGVRVQMGTFGELDSLAVEQGPAVYLRLVGE